MLYNYSALKWWVDNFVNECETEPVIRHEPVFGLIVIEDAATMSQDDLAAVITQHIMTRFNAANLRNITFEQIPVFASGTPIPALPDWV